MNLKKSIALIMGIVFVLTVVSGAFLYMQGGTQSGGVSSTTETKYDHIIDTSVAYTKTIQGGARNGSIKSIGAACYQYSEVILTATLNQDIGADPVELVKPNSGDRYTFSLRVPSEITISAGGNNTFGVYLCWVSDAATPDEDPTVRHLIGYGRDIRIDDYPPGYGGEEIWIEIASWVGTLHISRMVVQMIPYTAPSGVTQVIATSKNLIDYRGATLRDNKTPLELVDNGVVMPAGADYYISIPVSLPPGTYSLSYSGNNDAGETVGNYAMVYDDGTRSSPLRSGMSTYHPREIVSVYIYKHAPTKALTMDLIINQIQLEIGSTSTEYTPYFADKVVLTVPEAVTKLPEYGVGSGALYNYLDLISGTYVQMCKLIGTDVVPLDEPKIIDISHYLPPGSDKLDLYGVGSLIFVNPYDTDVPSEVAYRRIIN